MHTVTISDRQSEVVLDADRIRQVVESALVHCGARHAEISVVFVDDGTIHELNRRHLAHDYATDVLSFVLSDSSAPLEAEVIVSTETALREASRFGWGAEAEVCLYTVHGVLHACGHDDHTAAGRAAMRRAERAVLKNFGLTPKYAARSGTSLPARRRPLRIME